MKIDNYKLKSKKKTKILVGSIVGVIALGGGYILNRSYGKYQVSQSFPIMEGKINVFGDADVLFAVYKDGSYADEIPGKSDGYRFDKAVCTNGTTATWNKTDWSVKVNSLKKTKTKCSLYFLQGEEPVGGTKIEDKLNNLVNDSYYDDQIIYEQNGSDNNIRFIGVDPDNYVTFNGEPWRIIGLMDNVVKKDGNKEKLLKIIKNDKMPSTFVWDISGSKINWQYGVNEWSQADLMYALKKYSGDTTVNNCGDSSCPSWGTLNATAQSMIEEVIWNTGTTSTTDFYDLITPKYFYKVERSSGTGKQCTSSSGTGCTDTVTRQPTWTGKVGLMYPSDYGYATNGGQLKNRKQCLEISMNKWNDSSNNYCYVNDWLYDLSNDQWTITPTPNSFNAYYVFSVRDGGQVTGYSTNSSNAVRPVVYLKSSVKITGGDGTSENPYILTI